MAGSPVDADEERRGSSTGAAHQLARRRLGLALAQRAGQRSHVRRVEPAQGEVSSASARSAPT